MSDETIDHWELRAFAEGKPTLYWILDGSGNEPSAEWSRDRMAPVPYESEVAALGDCFAFEEIADGDEGYRVKTVWVTSAEHCEHARLLAIEQAARDLIAALGETADDVPARLRPLVLGLRVALAVGR